MHTICRSGRIRTCVNQLRRLAPNPLGYGPQNCYFSKMNSKICSKCRISKNVDEFYFSSAKKTTRFTYCKSCFNSYCVERWRAKKLKFVELMGGRCEDCGFSGHQNVFDFHHLYGKDYDWTKLRLKSNDKILDELKKCVLLCANCHRVRHSN
jgi:hypothetical protein